MPNYSIYYLSGPLGDDIFYVGHTSLPLSIRLQHHRSSAKFKNCSNGLKNKKIFKYWDCIEIHRLEIFTGNRKKALEREKFWINKMAKDGHKLLNAELIPICDRVVEETGYTSIKIKKEHYELLRHNKKTTGINIDRFVGDLIVEKLQNSNTKK